MDTVKLTREQLYEMVWQEPMSTIAKRYKITDTGLRKACERMNIPTPSNGHWMKLMHGKTSEKIELPSFFEGDGIFQIQQIGEESVVNGESDLSRIRKEILGDTRLDLTVPLTLKNACKMVTDVNELLKESAKDKYYRKNDLLFHYGSGLDVKVTPENLNRMLRFADALIKNLKIRGHEVYFENNTTKLDLFGEKFPIVFRECLRREIRKDPKSIWDNSRMVPTGILSFRTTSFHQREWREGKQTLEKQLPNIMAQLEVMGLKWKKEMDGHRAQWEKQEREEKLEKERLERKQNELQLFQNLSKEAKRFNEAQIIRNYISEIENRFGSETLPIEKTFEWILWAKEKADWIDPLVAKSDLILGNYSAIIEPKNR